MLTRADMCAYVQVKYRTRPEQPWQRCPDRPALRHRLNAKWYAVIMNIARSKAGLHGAGQTDIINLKLDSSLKNLPAGTKGLLRPVL